MMSLPDEIDRDESAEGVDRPVQAGSVVKDRRRAWDLDPIFANDPEFLVLIERFVATLPESYRQIIAAQASRNSLLLTRTVHDLKGSAGMYGFETLGRTAKLILEAVQRKEEWLFVDGLIGVLAKQLDAILEGTAPVSS